MTTQTRKIIQIKILRMRIHRMRRSNTMLMVMHTTKILNLRNSQKVSLKSLKNPPNHLEANNPPKSHCKIKNLILQRILINSH